MRSVQEIITSPWRGSEHSEAAVREQVRLRFGDEVADSFSSRTDAMSFAAWLSRGFVPLKNSKSLKSVVIIEVKDKKTGEIVKKIRRVVNLFHRNDVVKLNDR